jgi:arabinan endo-1,5-alpha-L-arabinosidase
VTGALAAFVMLSTLSCELFFPITERDDATGVAPIDGGDKTTDAPVDGGSEAIAADATAPNDVTRGLIAHWRFDEANGDVAIDSAPNANHGKLIAGDAGLPARVAGVRGGALAFDAHSHLEVPAHPSLKLPATFSVALWVDAPSNIQNAPRLFVYGASFDMKLNDRNIQIELGGQYAIASYQLPLDRWTHYAVVFENGRAAWYVDALPVTNVTDTFSGTVTAPDEGTTPLYIAVYSDRTSPFTGMLDDVRVYGVALTTAEIATLAKK